MKIKSTVWQVLAAGSFGAGLLYALGIEGTAQVGGTISDSQFITAMVLILLALFGKLFHHNRVIYISVTACTLVTALFDLVQSLPYGLPEKPVLRNIVEVGNLLPFSELGLSWVCPAAVGLVIGVVLHLVCRKKPEAA